MTTASLHIPQIETDRLILRAPQASDLARLTAFFASDRSHSVGATFEREAELLGTPCQIFRHPRIGVT